MGDLIRINWRAIDPLTTAKVSIGLLVMLLIDHLTGESWLVTGLVVLFVWMANMPGSLKVRIGGMLSFAGAAIAITLLWAQIELSLWPNIAAIAVIGFAGTIALLWGMRAFIIGFSLICWTIYGPFLVATTSVWNCVLAIILGTGIMIVLTSIAAFFEDEKPGESAKEESAEKPDSSYVYAYATTVAIVLALTTYYGWVGLETDPTLMVGGAYFVIGFDVNKTWSAGIGRALGLIGGAFLGLAIAHLLGPGLLLDAVMILACGLSFGAAAAHPGAWMFFFMIFIAIGWPGLDPELFDLTANERFYGEFAGILAAMVAIIFLQWWQTRRSA